MKITGKVLILVLIASALVLSGVASEAAEKPAQKDTFLCAITKSSVCDGDSCTKIEPETVDLPPFVKIDLKNKVMTDVEAMGGRKAQKKTPIREIQRVADNIILQGIELRAWSMLISEKTGKMTLTASDDEEAGVFFGICTPI